MGSENEVQGRFFVVKHNGLLSGRKIVDEVEEKNSYRFGLLKMSLVKGFAGGLFWGSLSGQHPTLNPGKSMRVRFFKYLRVHVIRILSEKAMTAVTNNSLKILFPLGSSEIFEIEGV